MPAVLLWIIVVLIIVGAVIYIVRLLPIDAVIKQIITAITIVICAIWILMTLLGGYAPAVHMR